MHNTKIIHERAGVPTLARRSLFAVATLATGLLSQAATAQVYITEWMYNGNGGTGEYIEFTNMGDSAVDFSGWSFDDDSRAAGTVSLSLFGVVNPGQSVILTEAAPEDFRSVWSLSANRAHRRQQYRQPGTRGRDQPVRRRQ